MVEYVSGLPPITVNEYAINGVSEFESIRTALHVNTDPVTGVMMFELYFDDGHGNGNCILAVPVAELWDIAKRLSDPPAVCGWDKVDTSV